MRTSTDVTNGRIHAQRDRNIEEAKKELQNINAEAACGVFCKTNKQTEELLATFQ